MRFGEPVNRAGAPINLGIRVALRASGNVKQLAVVWFFGFVHARWVRPRGKVSPHEVCWWIVVRLRCCLVSVGQMVRGEEVTACWDEAQSE